MELFKRIYSALSNLSPIEEESLLAISRPLLTLTLSKVLVFTNLEHAIGAVLSAVQGKNLSNIMPKHIEYLYIPAVDH